ncbi:hypothetical protein [Fulvimonas yonginensis]|uniref:Uncharacterized protein n=1 Tax=Fulvimonas yonginensis TaxID=1495200 RepID=A0ABU8JAI7_9GAMM
MAHQGKSAGIGLFPLLTWVLSCVFYTATIATGHLRGAMNMYVTRLMWCPGIAALLTCRLRGEGFGRLGWRWGAWRWQWLAYLVPLGYVAVAYAVVSSTGRGGFGDAQFLERIATALGWKGAPAWLDTTVTSCCSCYFVLLASTGMARSLSMALGEEIGWRGFLAPALVGRLGFTGGALGTGVI